MLDSQLNLKIGDFGLSAFFTGSVIKNWNITHVGTPGFHAPEILNS